MSSLAKYSKLGIDVASTATSVGFSVAKTGTKLGFGIARGITSTIASAAGTSVDYVFFGGAPGVGPALGGAVSAAFTMVEQVALAPILLGETVTSVSLVAAQSSVDFLAAFFPGSDEASFSLASFVALVKREWNEPVLHEHLPEERFSVAETAKALMAWAALQSVTSEWQERKWFQHLKEIDVGDGDTSDHTRKRTESRIRITSDVGRVITADIWEARTVVNGNGNGRGQSLAMRSRMPNERLKSNLRRFSKMVLAGYGGAGLIFFGVSLTPTPAPTSPSSTNNNAKTAEEHTLADAIDASEMEANSSSRNPAPPPQKVEQKPYSWWNVLLGRHDQDIFEGYAFTPATVRVSNRRRERSSTVIVGKDKSLPRYWVLTDHGRRQVVLVFRGTMSINELAVDLTCDPAPFTPAFTPPPDRDEAEAEDVDDMMSFMPGSLPFPSLERRPTHRDAPDAHPEEHYIVHGGMLRMTRAMGEKDKPVHRAVRDALWRNRGYELILCGHSLGAGVASLLALTWADPRTCLTVRGSGLPAGRRVSAYCYAPPCLTCPALSKLSSDLITSFAYSTDIVTRLSLGSVRDMTRAAAWLCSANVPGKDGREAEGYAAVMRRTAKWKAGYGEEDDETWFLAVRKTLEANMHFANLFPPGRVLWAARDGDLHSSHQSSLVSTSSSEDKIRLFEVLEVEKVFGQIVFARDMLSSHLPHEYDRVLHELT